MTERQIFEFSAKVWTWRPGSPKTKANWYFVTIEGQTSAEIRLATLGLKGGFGSIRVRAAIGTTTWDTSIFPNRELGGWVLPLKADVRKREGINAGDALRISLEI